MKTFKQFKSSLKKVKWKESPIHFKSAFSEHPTKVRKNTSSEKVNEEFTPFKKKIIKYTHGAWEDEGHNIYDKDNRYGASYDGDFHDHEDIKPQKLEPHHIQAIHNYCSVKSSDEENGHGSSANINGMLRNMDGDKSSRVIRQDPEDVKKSIHTLSSAFTKDNTNRKEITTWGGIPPHIGKKLMEAGVGSHHHLSGFTSTSSSNKTAIAFGRKYIENSDSDSDNEDGLAHIVQYHIKPGAGLSVVHHSPYDEDEVMLHHGAHIEYHGHQVIQHKKYKYSKLYQELYLHHVTVHPEHKSLDEYGQYDHPKD